MKPAALAAAVSCLLLGLLTCACLTPDQIQAMQKDVTDIRAQVEALRKENKDTAASVKSLQSALQGTDTGREQAAETRRQLEGIRDDIRAVSSRLEELEHQLSGLSPSNPGAIPRATIPPRSPAPPAAGGDEAATPPSEPPPGADAGRAAAVN